MPPLGAELLLRELLGLAERLVGRREDEVLEHLDVVGIHGLGVDRQRLDAHVAAHHDLDHPAAGRRLDPFGLERLLRLLLRGHHLLRLLEHRLQVRWLGHQFCDSSVSSGTISSASNSALKRSTSSSSERTGALGAQSSSASRSS